MENRLTLLHHQTPGPIQSWKLGSGSITQSVVATNKRWKSIINDRKKTVTETQTLYVGAHGVKYLDENAAAESLKRYPGQNAKKSGAHYAEAQALERFQLLNANQKQRHLEQIQKAMGLSSHQSDGVSNDVAAANRAKLKSYPRSNTGKMPELSKKVRKMFDGVEDEQHLTDEFKEAATEIFEAAVEDRAQIMMENATIRDVMESIFRTDPAYFSLMFLEEGSNVEAQIEHYAARIDDLEQGIAVQLQERNRLLRQRAADLQELADLKEDVVIQQNERPARRRRRSLTEDAFENGDDMLFANEEPHQPRSGDRMAVYESHLQKSILTSDFKSSPVSGLTEAWRLKD